MGNFSDTTTMMMMSSAEPNGMKTAAPLVVGGWGCAAAAGPDPNCNGLADWL